MTVDYLVKELKKEDLVHCASFFDTLGNLREVGNLSLEEAEKILFDINSQNGHIYIAQKNDGEIIGSTTLLVEQKFIRGGGKVGHIEDVATRKGYEKMGIGSAVVKKAIETAKGMGCYKVILDCADDNIPFYERLGFYRHENGIRLDLK